MKYLNDEEVKQVIGALKYAYEELRHLLWDLENQPVQNSPMIELATKEKNSIAAALRIMEAKGVRADDATLRNAVREMTELLAAKEWPAAIISEDADAQALEVEIACLVSRAALSAPAAPSVQAAPQAPPAAANGWLPIETMPRDTDVLVCGVSGCAVAIKGTHEIIEPAGVYATYDGAGGVAFEIGNLTHWQPLPAAPQ